MDEQLVVSVSGQLAVSHSPRIALGPVEYLAQYLVKVVGFCGETVIYGEGTIFLDLEGRTVPALRCWLWPRWLPSLAGFRCFLDTLLNLLVRLRSDSSAMCRSLTPNSLMDFSSSN